MYSARAVWAVTLSTRAAASCHCVSALDLAHTLMLLYVTWKVKIKELLGRKEAACGHAACFFHIYCTGFGNVLAKSQVIPS